MNRQRDSDPVCDRNAARLQNRGGGSCTQAEVAGEERQRAGDRQCRNERAGCLHGRPDADAGQQRREGEDSCRRRAHDQENERRARLARAQPACDGDNAREREQLGAIACRPDRSERDSDRQAGSLDLGERSDRRDRSRSWQGASEERKACCVTGARRQERVHDRAGTVVRPRDDERDATAGPAGSGAPGRTRARRRRDKARKREREERPIPAAEHSARLAQVAAYGIDHRLQFRHVPRDPVLQAGDELGAALCQRAAWLTGGW